MSKAESLQGKRDKKGVWLSLQSGRFADAIVGHHHEDIPQEEKDGLCSEVEQVEQADRDRLEWHRNKGDRAYQQKQYQKALKNYSSALEYALALQEKGQALYGHMQLGRCCVHMNQLVQALYHVEKIFKLTEGGAKEERAFAKAALYLKLVIHHKNNEPFLLAEVLNQYDGWRAVPAPSDLHAALIKLQVEAETGKLSLDQIRQGLQQLATRHEVLGRYLAQPDKTMIDSEELVGALVIFATICLRVGEEKQAERLLRKLEEVVGGTDLFCEKKTIYSLLGELALDRGEGQAGQTYFNKLKTL